MTIERTAQEIIIRLPANVDISGLQRLVNYLAFKEAVSQSKATQADADTLAKEAKAGWWEKNKHRFPDL